MNQGKYSRKLGFVLTVIIDLLKESLPTTPAPEGVFTGKARIGFSLQKQVGFNRQVS